LVSKAGRDVVYSAKHHFPLHPPIRAPASYGFQCADCRVIVVRKIFDDMIVIDGESMARMDGCGRSAHEDSRRYLGL
jgi:hypothetical protein